LRWSTIADVAVGWGADGHSIYLARSGSPLRLEVCDTVTGARRLWKEIFPPDPVGVLTIAPLIIGPHGKSYVYSYRRQLDELILVTGLK
jgi:hypothetical protein